MKICILGDTHFGARNDGPAFHKFFERFYAECFFPYMEEHGIDYVIQLGDVFDRRKYINFNTLQESHRYFFQPLDSRLEKSWLLVGNHDTYYKNTNDVNSPALLLQQYENIHAVTSPYETSFGGTSILFIPWICDDNHEEVMEAINKSKSQIVVGHFEIDGFEMYRGSVHQGGMSRDVFDKFELVLSGHFHHRSKHGNIHYLGTPYEMTWSDYDDPKGFHILDTDTRELTFVENPFRMFYKVFYDDTDKQTAEVLSIDFEKYKETYVKLIVQNKTNPYTFDLFVTKLEEAGVHNVQVVDDHKHLDAMSDDEIVEEAENTLSLLTKYVRQMDDSIDKPQLEDLMRHLYQEALSVESLKVE